jgi:hypothetical protein
LAFCCLVSTGCNKRKQKRAESPVDVVTGTRADDQSRCEFEGRDDRDVQESSAPGSVTANVRRVYGYIGEGTERRRILLCREADTNFDGVKDVMRTYGDHGQRLMEQADSDYDGKIDTWITFGKTRAAKVEFDKSGDGKPDEIRFYTAGQLTRVQRDTNADEKPDIFEIYRDGRLERMGVDADHDGKVDVWHRDEIRIREEEAKEAEEASEGESSESTEGEASSDG